MTETEGRKVAAEIADVIVEFMTGTGATDVLDLDEIVAPAIDAAIERARVTAVARIVEGIHADADRIGYEPERARLRDIADGIAERLAGPSAYVALSREKIAAALDAEAYEDALDLLREAVAGGSDAT